MTDEELKRLHLPIGSTSEPARLEETAISIAAEIVQARWGGSGRHLTDTNGPIHRVLHDERHPCAMRGCGARCREWFPIRRAKAPLEVDGERLVDRSVRVLHRRGCDPIFVDPGERGGKRRRCPLVIESRLGEGMGSSLRIASDAVERDHRGRLHAHHTHRTCQASHLESVQRVAAADGGIAVATFDGERGHPVRIPREHFRELIDTVGSDEARSLMSQGRNVVLVEIWRRPQEETSTCQVTLLGPSRWRLSL